ncbi:lipase 3-like [Glossina fuscipes fuscipes]
MTYYAHKQAALKKIFIFLSFKCFFFYGIECVNTENDLNTWSIKVGNYHLFNIPTFGFSFSNDPVTPTTSGYNFFDAKSKEFDLDPDVVEDALLSTPDLVKKYGYPSEVHYVQTEDGYILQLHRIARSNCIPVLLVHGLLDSSATWIQMGPEKGLGYLLHDEGYDVWMANVRGNTYSRNHTKYNTKQPIFWEFSFHEMGLYDIPAIIDYILQQTKRQQLHYIGHSQGTAIFWIMCSERPEYSEKVLLMQALAPVAYLEHAKSPVVSFLAFFEEPLGILLKLIGAHEFLPSNEFLKMFNQIICDDDSITETICSNVMFLVAGFDKNQMNETMLPVALGHAPAGASTKQMQHFGQLKKSGYFRQYDYGWIRNHWRYQSSTPPNYEIENTKCRVALHYALNDWLATPQDVERLHQRLPNALGKFKVNYPKFNHLDFVWGINARDLLYNKLIKIMKLVEKNYF